MRFGLNLWALNPAFTADPEGFLSAAKSLHYRYLEPVLSLSSIPAVSERIWTPDDFKTYAPLLSSAGFSIMSCHVFSSDPLAEAEKLADMASEYGIRQLVFPCPAYSSVDQYTALAVSFTRLSEFLGDRGIETLLHNNGTESTVQVEGLSACEWMIRHTGDKVGAQVDVGWLQYGGIDPVAFLWRNESKIRSLHYKDMKASGDGTDTLTETPVGTGLVDMAGCFQFARYAEIVQILDQDQYQADVMKDLQFVADTFRSLSQCRNDTRSVLCVYDVTTGKEEVLSVFDRIIEAPNWMQTEADTLLYNSEGRIWKYSISKGTEEMVSTGHCTNCNNDHVLSPDNRQIAVSHSESGWMSQIYICNLDGTGEPQLITPQYPSFLHGWSFDGKELAYCAFRQKETMAVDIYVIPSSGGTEKALTRDAGFNDGPEYAPDDSAIWFISTRTGLMQCWKMNRDGSGQKQMTFSERNNWFPHVSPDMKKVVYLSYSKDGLDAEEHLPNMKVQIRMMDYDGSNDRSILEFFGGQGSINVNSWNPESTRFAYVRYTLTHQ